VRADVVGSVNIATSGGNSTATVIYPAIDALKTRGPWVAEYSFCKNTTATPTSPPAGMTRRAGNATASPAGSAVVDDTNAVVATFAQRTTALAPAVDWLTASVELLLAGANDIPTLIRESQTFLMASAKTQAAAQIGQEALLTVYGPPAAKRVDISQEFGLVPYSAAPFVLPRVSQLALMVVYGTGLPDTRRSRAWWFILDGHTFYVLDLGEEGTFVYDTLTKQWAQWYTEGYAGQWNMKAGAMWGSLRPVAGDAISGEVRTLDPNTLIDDEFRTIRHVVTGGIVLRGRVYVGMSQLRLIGSAGNITDDTGTATVSMRFSDDMGRTWSDPYDVVVTEGDFSEETSWRSLGSFMEPGRVIEISDAGGAIRIDALDGSLDGFDEPPSPSTGASRG
jgi:hypothetical protein